ncbi:MAG: hypothetical protein NUV56_02375 [Candidatus Uhrbacteria bacterium]|nr:hypothetical protein [Candidatus Uhrbacteria bacterium]
MKFIEGLFKRKEPVDKDAELKKMMVEKAFTETAKPAYENLKPTDAQMQEAQAEAVAKAEDRRARGAAEQAAAKKKLETVREAEWIEVQAPDADQGQWEKTG